jgi:hypothetical protein
MQQNKQITKLYVIMEMEIKIILVLMVHAYQINHNVPWLMVVHKKLLKNVLQDYVSMIKLHVTLHHVHLQAQLNV